MSSCRGSQLSTGADYFICVFYRTAVSSLEPHNFAVHFVYLLPLYSTALYDM